MNWDALFLKNIINELDMLKKEIIIQWNVFLKKIAVASNQINRNTWSL